MPRTEIRPKSAVDRLMEQHQLLRGLFLDFEAQSGGHPETAKRVWGEIERLLREHARAEEGLFYPALSAAHAGDGLVEPLVEAHRLVRSLLASVAELERRPEESDYPIFCALVGCILEHMRQHMLEEEEGLFELYRRLPLEERLEISRKMDVFGKG